ncbi:Diacylglycerol kinase [Sodalis praecaptivus]|uniref:diacylglycerol kinase n=1 Tax=Sodalis praecaptivus TaxID=1239307 RepID=UPI0027E79899|nr:diacylglycerol kinase [Sodalis praecaptivus]CAJ0998889.1 Diacylglycerol kinase [Sodalis praecaptivus]
MNNKHTGLIRLSRATVYSFQGIRAAWRHEAAFRQEIVLGALAIAVACWLDIDAISRLLLILPVILVAVVELLNSAIEALIDRVSPERHPLAGRAKDMGSAAVLMAIVLAATSWLTLLWHHYG